MVILTGDICRWCSNNNSSDSLLSFTTAPSSNRYWPSFKEVVFISISTAALPLQEINPGKYHTSFPFPKTPHIYISMVVLLLSLLFFLIARRRPATKKGWESSSQSFL
jgi:hypothetical protein